MEPRWRYRIAAVSGAAVLTAFAVAIGNLPILQTAITTIPVLGNLEEMTIRNGKLTNKLAVTLVIVLGSLWPLFKPRPRRILDTISLTQKRVLIAAAALATIGYFDWSTRLPRTTLIGTTAILLVVLPIWLVYIRRRPQSSTQAIIVGDDPEIIQTLWETAELPIKGVVAPPGVTLEFASERVTDGGLMLSSTEPLPRLGGLSRLDEVLVDYDVDTVLLGFKNPDREEFFGTLSTCYEHGIWAKVHRDHADSVLVSKATGEDLVDTELEPWDWQDYVVKRMFDVSFAVIGFVLLSPLIVLIAAAVKVSSPGPVFYSQQRTAEFGETFTVYKFRSMIADAEALSGARLSDEDAGGVDPRVTTVGRVLRRTHLDEIPQLWSVLVGDMSVVGPRPERPELDADIGTTMSEWRSRWFVKPGLTGLSQVNGITGHDPERKLRYDIEYIRRQSFWFDLKIVVRQLYLVSLDVLSILGGRLR